MLVSELIFGMLPYSNGARAVMNILKGIAIVNKVIVVRNFEIEKGWASGSN